MDKENQEAANQLAKLNQRIGKAEALAEKPVEPESEQSRIFINALFDRLFAICTAWAQSYVGLTGEAMDKAIGATKREWLDHLKLEGIKQAHVINYAVNRVKASGSPFLPTSGQFVAWCREGNVPEGTRTPAEAYKEISEYQCLPRELRKPQGLSSEVYHTLVNLTDLPAWRHMHEKKHREYWDAEYQRTLEVLRNGGPIKEAPPPRKALENKRTPLDKAKAISAIQAMRKGLE